MAGGYGEWDPGTIALRIFNIAISGFGEDSAVTIEPSADHRSHKVGLDGRVVSAKSRDESAIATVTVMETSPAHQALMGVYRTDKARPGGAGAGGFELKDLVNGGIESSEVCWIQRRPTKTVGKEVPEYEWKFILAKWESSHPDDAEV